MTPQDLEQQLRGFTGTENYYFNPLYRRMKYTDGVKFFAEAAGAFWFLDIVGTEIHPKQNPDDPFMHIQLRVKDDKAAILVTDGNSSSPILPIRDIDYTDCPEGDWSFYLEGDVLLLPSEH